MKARRVYFIKPVGLPGPIKIGCSQSPDGRRKTLEVWSPFALEIVAEIDGDAHLERRFHAKFFDHHQRGEWFDATPELVETIACIARGDFDPSTLPEAKRLPRQPASNDYLTPDYRYHTSVCARFRHLGGYPFWNAEFLAILGDQLHGDWLPFRDEIEALIERLRNERKAA